MSEIDDMDEAQLQKLENELKDLGVNLDDGKTYGSPAPADKDSIFKFFRELLATDNSTKIGNLQNTEIGLTKLGMRHYLEIAAYAEAEGLEKVAQYLERKAEIVVSTSMSRKGFFTQLFVTQIKKEQKVKEPIDKKKGWFVKKTGEEDLEN